MASVYRSEGARQHIALTALLVADYDEAISFYVGKLGFLLAEDRVLSPGKRWIVVRPPGAQEGGLLLALASNDQQRGAVGNQSGGRVFLFLQTDDFDRDHAAFTAHGVRFVEEPRREASGSVAVFEDLYGNRWDLLQLS